VFSRSDLLEQAVLGDFLDVLGFATYHIPLITKEFWDAFRVIFNAFERVEIDLAEGIYCSAQSFALNFRLLSANVLFL
jgi:hypothetical protein